MWKCTRRLHVAPPTSADINAAFKVLGLSYNPYLPQATLHDQVRKNYRDLARLHHPDLSSGDNNRMKVINTAYELIQSSGVLQGAAFHADGMSTDSSPAAAAHAASADGDTAAATHGKGVRFARKAGSRRHRIPDDFASGDDVSGTSWSMKSSLDWQSLMNSTQNLTPQELSNPANHPFSHSKFFTFDEDVTIYKMIRGGATVPQVARTLGKPSTFIEKRLHNAQFKLRVQYVLRGEKRTSRAGATHAPTKPRHGGDQPHGPTPSPPSRPNAQERLFARFSPHDELATEALSSRERTAPGLGTAAFDLPPLSGKYAQRTSRKKEWEATLPEWERPQYFADMSLEEKGRFAKILNSEEKAGDDSPVWGVNAVNPPTTRSRAKGASKIGRSYSNYARLRPKQGSPHSRH